jgi:NitT/TauT family transport system substrate-binding protein
MRWLMLLLCLTLAGCDRGAEPTTQASGEAATDSQPAAVATRPPRATGPVIKLALNWKPEPQFGGFYAAKDQGSFDTRDLNVEILPGGSGTPVVQMVIAGQAPYGIASGDEIVIARSKGQDVVALFAVYQTCPQGILVRADRGLRSLADVFASGTVAMQRGLPYAMHLEKTYGFGRVTVVPYPGGVAGLLNPSTGASFAQQCFVTSEPILLQENGVEPQAFLVADSGYNPYTTVLIARGDHVRANLPQVGAMIAAVREGWQAYLDDPTQTNALMLQLNPGMDARTFARSAELQKPLIAPPELSELGAMNLYRWQLLIEQLLDLGVIDKPVPAAELFLSGS